MVDTNIKGRLKILGRPVKARMCKMKKVLRMILVLLFFVSIFYCKAEENPLIILFVGADESGSVESINVISSWYQNQGYAFKTIAGTISAEELKNQLKAEWKDNKLVACILPVKYSKKSISFKIGDEVFEQKSDKYYSNLDDDKNMTSEIVIARATVAEMVDISRRQLSTEIKADFAMPISNFAASACVPGQCWEYKKSDPSYLGQDCKKMFLQKGYKTNTYFETEGSMTSAQKPDFSLTEENIRASDANFRFFMDTKELWITHSEGYATSSFHKEFNRAILVDANKNNLAEKGEVSVQKFYSFSKETETKIQKIGFLPLFENQDMNLNEFSSIIGIEHCDAGKWVVYGDGTGLTASQYAVFRLVIENLVNGKTVGESIDVYKQYKDKFPLDKYHQEVFALTLFVRGNPMMRLSDLLSQASLKFEPIEIEKEIDFGYKTEKRFTIENIGTSDLVWETIEKPEWIKMDKESGTIKVGEKVEVKLKIENMKGLLGVPRSHSAFLKIKSNDPKKVITEIKVRGRLFSWKS